jgi:Domain of unknown function (DUF4404)
MTQKHEVDERLRQLHQDLQQLELPDVTERRLLELLQTDIQAVLSQGERHDPQPYTQLGERLQEGIEQLETAHPRLTLAMGQIVEMLARMGI